MGQGWSYKQGGDEPSAEDLARAREQAAAIKTVAKDAAQAVSLLVSYGINLSAAKVAAKEMFGLAKESKVTGVDDAYVNSVIDKKGSAAISGGCGCGGGIRLGGMDEYMASGPSRAKEAFIDQVLAMAKEEGIKFTSTDRISQLKEYIAAIGNTSSAGAEARCRKLAQKINATYGDIINTSLPLKDMCIAVAEVLTSFRSGMYAEFLSVYQDTQNVLHNLNFLAAAMREQIKGMESELAKDGTTKLRGNVAVLDMILKELDRQIGLISNLMNSGGLDSTAKMLASAALRNGDVASYIKRLKATSGSEAAGIFEATLKRGVVVSALMAAHVEAALKKVGLTIDEFKKADTPQKLSQAVLDGLLKMPGSISDNIEAYEAATAVLKQFADREQLIKLMEAKKTGSAAIEDFYGGYAFLDEGVYGGSADFLDEGVYGGSADFLDEGVYGGARKGRAGRRAKAVGGLDDDWDGAYDNEGYPKSEIERRKDAQDALRDLVMESFVRAVNDKFNGFVIALNTLSQRVGREVNPGETLTEFVGLLDRVKNTIVNRPYAFYALIGYYNDAMSNSVKEEFIGNLRMLVRVIDGMLALPDYAKGAQYFRDVKDALNGVLSVIDKYSAEIVAKFGSGEHSAEISGGFITTMSPSSVQTIPLFTTLLFGAGENGKGDEGDPVVPVDGGCGGVLGGIYGGADHKKFSVAYRPSKSIETAITAFVYNARAATIRENLKGVSASVSEFGKDQSDLNAQSISRVLEEKRRKYDALHKAYSASGDKAALEILRTQWEARRAFWSVIESMDACMRMFTNGILTSIDNIKTIDALLNDVEVIADWVGKRTGNDLAELFEAFPTGLPTTAGADPDEHKNPFSVTKGHYYDEVSLLPGGDGVGLPFVVQLPEKVQGAYKKLENTLLHMTALKNLFSVFTHFGRAVGSDALKSSGVKGPRDLYRGTIQYLRASTFAQGFMLDPTWWNAEKSELDTAFTTAAGVHSVNCKYPSGAASYDAGVTTDTSALTGNALKRAQFGIRMRSICADLEKSDLLGWALEDKYFVHMIKAASAKILTVTGSYALFSRPVGFEPDSQRLSPVRFILGGGMGDAPEIIPDAVPLYMRLPLLIHWYRRIFDSDDKNVFDKYDEIPLSKKDGKDRLKISYVPDIDGTFAKLIRMIFRDMRAVDTASYTDSDIREIVKEVNVIYQRQSAKHPGNVFRGTINDLVDEINRRYGIVSESMFESEYERSSRGYDYSDISAKYGEVGDDNDLAILPDEDSDLPSAMTPSERLYVENSTLNYDGRTVKRQSRYNITLQHEELIKKFRCAIDRALEGDGKLYEFDQAVAATQNELRSITAPDRRFDAVARLVRCTDMRTTADGMKYVMFNETVIAGLNVLSGIHSMLKRFQTHMLFCDYARVARYLFAARNDRGRLADDVLSRLIADYKWIDNSAENRDLIRDIIRDTGAAAFRSNYAGKPAMGATADDERKILDDFVAKYRSTASSSKTIRDDVHGVFDHQFVAREILETLMALGDGQNISVSIGDSRLVVSYGGIEETVKSIFASVFHFLNVLRPRVDDALIARYVDKMSPGSFYWLQEQLLEKIINGRDPRNINDHKEYISLEKTSRGIAATWDVIIDKNVSLAGMFSSMIFYDAEKAHSGLMGSSVAPNNSTPAMLNDYRTDPFEELIIGGPSDKRQLDTRFAARFKQLYTWRDEFTQNRSLLFDFNQLVAKYIQAFYDPNNRKIYTGLVDKIANGAFAQAVNDPVNYTYPDCAPAIQVKFGPPTNNPVSQVHNMSLAYDGIYLGELSQIIEGALTGEDTDYLLTKWSVTRAVDGSNIPDFVAKMVQWVKANVTTVPGTSVRLNGARMLAFDVTTGAPNPAGITSGSEYIDAFNQANAGNGAAFRVGESIRLSVNFFPFRDNMSTGADLAQRSRFLASLILWMAKAKLVPPPPGKTYADGMIAQLRSTYSVPQDGRAGNPQFTVIGDDIGTMDASNPGTSVLAAGAVEKSSLVFARPEAIRNAANADSFQSLGGKNSLPAGTRKAASLAEATTFGQRADPDADHVLFMSLAVTLRTLVSTKTTGSTTSVYLLDNVADMPNHMKERMRANLPMFRCFVDELSRRCETIKSVIGRRRVNLTRNAKVGGGADPLNPWPYTLAARTTDSEKTKQRFEGIIGAVLRGCVALRQSIEQALREVGDDPKYFEMNQGSIRDYAAQNGMQPFAPLSSTLAVLRNGDVGLARQASNTYMDFFPVHAYGEPQFKMMYGTRGLLTGAKATLESVQGFTDILRQYNMIAGSVASVDDGAAQTYLDQFVCALRWLNGSKRIRGLLSSYCQVAYNDAIAAQVENAGVLSRHDLVSTNALPSNNTTEISLTMHDGTQPRAVRSIVVDLEDTVRQTESSMRDEKITGFIEHFYKRGKLAESDYVVQNVLALNIVPINVHALMKSVPFASLLNYSFSADRMLIEVFYGEREDKNIRKLLGELCNGGFTVRSAKDMLVALLIDPYRPITASDLSSLEGMLRGAVPFDGLARPRFLADELFGKVIFGEVYCESEYYNEMGPGAGHAIKEALPGIRSADRQALLDNRLHTAMIIRINTEVLYGQRDGTGVDEINIIDNSASKGFLRTWVSMIHNYLDDKPSTTVASLKAVLSTVVTNNMYGDGFHRLINAPGSTVTMSRLDVPKRSNVPAAFAAANSADAGAAASAVAAIDSFAEISAWLAIFVRTWYNSSDRSAATFKNVSHFTSLPPAPITGTGSVPNALGVTLENSDIVAIRTIPKAKSAEHDASKLHYLAAQDDVDDVDVKQLKSVDVGKVPAGVSFKDAGAMRFDTVLVRNLLFIINMLRTVRMKLARDVFYGQGATRGAKSNIAPGLTELYGNRVDPGSNY